MRKMKFREGNKSPLGALFLRGRTVSGLLQGRSCAPQALSSPLLPHEGHWHYKEPLQQFFQRCPQSWTPSSLWRSTDTRVWPVIEPALHTARLALSLPCHCLSHRMWGSVIRFQRPPRNHFHFVSHGEHMAKHTGTKDKMTDSLGISVIGRTAFPITSVFFFKT